MLRYAVSKAHRVAAEQSKSAESGREKANLFRQVANANFASNNISAFQHRFQWAVLPSQDGPEATFSIRWPRRLGWEVVLESLLQTALPPADIGDK
jgi:hypothetical protein